MEADIAQVMPIRHRGDCQAKAGQETTFNTIAIKRDQDTPAYRRKLLRVAVVKQEISQEGILYAATLDQKDFLFHNQL